MSSFENIKERFVRGYIRPDQLKRYLDLKVITKKQYDEIIGGSEQHGADI